MLWFFFHVNICRSYFIEKWKKNHNWIEWWWIQKKRLSCRHHRMAKITTTIDDDDWLSIKSLYRYSKHEIFFCWFFSLNSLFVSVCVCVNIKHCNYVVVVGEHWLWMSDRILKKKFWSFCFNFFSLVFTLLKMNSFSKKKINQKIKKRQRKLSLLFFFLMKIEKFWVNKFHFYTHIYIIIAISFSHYHQHNSIESMIIIIIIDSILMYRMLFVRTIKLCFLFHV